MKHGKNGERYHTAIYCNKRYRKTKTQWIYTLQTNGATLDRQLAEHGSMQSVITAEYSTKEAQQISMNAFLNRAGL